MTYDTWEDISLTTTWTRAKKRSTYARLLKPGDSFFSPGLRTIYTVYKNTKEDPNNGYPAWSKVVSTTGKTIFYSHNERVQLV